MLRPNDERLFGAAVNVFQDHEDRRRELGQDIVAAGYLRGTFVLSSGQESSFYFDKYLFETKPTILRRIASMLGEDIPENIDRLAGVELGAVPLVTAASLETGLPFIIVRKAAKAHGTNSGIEGELHSNERVLLIEDIISTGGEAARAVRSLRRAGADVVGVLAVVDRQQGGAEAVGAEGLPCRTLFTLDELLPLRERD